MFTGLFPFLKSSEEYADIVWCDFQSLFWCIVIVTYGSGEVLGGMIELQSRDIEGFYVFMCRT